MWGACLFATALLAVQLLEGTSPYFALCSFAFILVSTATFNLAGGFSRSTGAYVFFFATLTLIVGLCTKAAVGEAGDSNLLVPQKTISLYLGSIFAMYCAVFAARKLTPRKAILQDLIVEKNMQNATVGCLAAGVVVQLVLTVTPTTSGTFLSALAQVNRFFPMAIILGVIHQIRKSGGRSSVNLPVVIAAGYIFFVGVLGFSKEGMFTPIACWMAVASCQGYKISRAQLVGIVAVFVGMFVFMVPYAQYGRSVGNPEDGFLKRVETSAGLLSNLSTVRTEYRATRDPESEQKHVYFNVDVGFFERLQMVSIDDSLIELTDRAGSHGLSPVWDGFQNLIPHFLWAKKPRPDGGNTYAHEVGGIIGEEDETTGISFSAVGEAYHLAKWRGIFLVAPMLWTMLFTLFDTLCGDIRLSPWGLLMIVYYAHMAPEGMLGGIIYAMGYVSFGLVVAALSAAYVMPAFGTLFKGPERTTLQEGGAVRSFPRRNATLPFSSLGQ
ncbi:MAG: hypothetical protein JST61_07750 [Acidobacteria bacterium]|nr:hypothetical protein [Acidobacteriota bacterium]